MKTKLPVLLFFFTISIILFGQDDWELLNPTPTINSGVDIHFVTDEIGYIITNKEILKTTDSGENWSISQEISSANDLNFHNSSGFIVGNSGFVIKSIDNGNTWNPISMETNDNYNSVNVINEDTVLISSSNKIVSSYDGGNNWQSHDITGYSVNKTFFINSKIGHAACNSGKILKTIDGGLNWYVTESVSYFPSDFLTIYFINSEVGFASREHNDILKTVDGGETWSEIDNTSDAIYSFYFIDELNGYISGDHGVIFKTTNGGASWEWAGFQSGRIYGTTIYAIHFIDNNVGFAVGLRGRILKTVDGGQTWNEYSPMYNDVKQMDFVTTEIGYALVGNELFKSIDGGENWENLGAPIPYGKTQRFSFISELIGFCTAGGKPGTSMDSKVLMKTTDGGHTWHSALPEDLIIHGSLYAVDFVNEDFGIVCTGGSAIFRVTGNNENWETISTDRFGQIQLIDEKVGYARRIRNYYNRIYKTIDGGLTWTNVFEIDEDINWFHFVDKDCGYFVGDNALIYKTLDGGNTWTEIDIPYEYYEYVRFYNRNIGYILDEDGKLYKTENAGATWELDTSIYGMSGIEIIDDNIYQYGSNGKILLSKISYSPAVVSSNEAEVISNREVQFSGNATSNSVDIEDIVFEYGINSLNQSVSAISGNINGGESVNVSATINGLESETSYMFRLKGTCNGVSYSSEIKSFTTLPEYTMAMNYYNNVSYNGAELSANVVSNEDDISDIVFIYGTNEAFNLSVEAMPGIVSEGSNVNVEGQLTDLEPETVYQARLKAIHKGVEIESKPISFTTAKEYEFDMYALNISDKTVNMNAYVRANKDTIKNIVLEYGTSQEYNRFVSANPNEVIKGGYRYIEANIGNLSLDSIYFCRLRGEMQGDFIYSREDIINMAGDIVMYPLDFNQTSDSGIILSSLINTGGQYISNINFHYGLSEDADKTTLASPYYVYGSKTRQVSAALSSLEPGATYYYKISGYDGDGQLHESELFTFKLEYNVGIDSNIIHQVKVYPNPTNGMVFFETESVIQQIQIFDSYGSLVHTKGVSNQLDISHLAAGIFIVKVFVDDEVIIRKIIKE